MTLWVLLKRNAFLEGIRLRKGADGAPTQVPETLRGKLPRDAVIVEGPNVRGVVPKQPQVLVRDGASSAHPLLDAVGVADIGRAAAKGLEGAEDSAEQQRLANLRRTEDALKASAKKGK